MGAVPVPILEEVLEAVTGDTGDVPPVLIGGKGYDGGGFVGYGTGVYGGNEGGTGAVPEDVEPVPVIGAELGGMYVYGTGVYDGGTGAVPDEVEPVPMPELDERDVDGGAEEVEFVAVTGEPGVLLVTGAEDVLELPPPVPGSVVE